MQPSRSFPFPHGSGLGFLSVGKPMEKSKIPYLLLLVSL
jgi:hypothetical protein